MARTSLLLKVAVVVAAATIATACSDGDGGSAMPDGAFPVVANADLAVGEQRLLVGLVTADATSYASAERDVVIDLYPPGSDEPSSSLPGVFMWTTPDVRGLYRTSAVFDVPGVWEIALRTDEGRVSDRIPFNVAVDGLTPAVGEAAPAPVTATASSESEIADISTDPDPDPRFYEVSLDAALRSGKPTVVVFATPAFCQTATCGPMLDMVKDVAGFHPDVNFIHVEVYENLDAASREDLVIVKAVEAWRLPSEPWVFVVDSRGFITAKFEGALDSEELTVVLEVLG
jgi:hypothetical protein